MKRQQREEKACGSILANLAIECLERRDLLTAISFVPHEVVQAENSKAAAVVTRDMDGDGDLDVLVGSDHGEIKVFENTDGKGIFEASEPIEIDYRFNFPIRDMQFGDVDADGDEDIFVDFATGLSGIAIVLENIDGTISSEAVEIGRTGDIALADVNKDGRTDLITFNTTYVSRSHDELVFDQVSNPVWFRRPLVVDVDRDGTIDVLDTRFNQATGDLDVSWFNSHDGSGVFANWIAIGTAQCEEIAVEDIDLDGDLDVITCDGVWFENLDDSGQFLERQTGAWWLPDFFDFDGDGDLDAVTGWSDAEEMHWQPNDGKGNFDETIVLGDYSFDETERLAAADLDGDGDLDVIRSSIFGTFDTQLVRWLENIDGAGTFGEPKAIGSSAFQDPNTTSAVDMDGDGDVDFFSLARGYVDRLNWLENTSGKGDFDAPIEINADVRFIAATTGDFDGDGDPDIIAAAIDAVSLRDYRVTLVRNIGNGQFGEPVVIDEVEDQPKEFLNADVDGDQDNDLVVKSHGQESWSWYENTDGLGAFSDRKLLNNQWSSSARSSLESIVATNLGQDSRLEVHSNYGETDFDGDGNLDFLVSQYVDSIGVVAWYPNTNGEEFGPGVIIDEGNSLSSRAAFAHDMDGDGDNDLLVGLVETSLSDNGTREQQKQFVWYENLNGLGTFGERNVISEDVGDISTVGVADFDGDGDLDPFAADEQFDKIGWFERRLSGDVNDDGTVEFADFLALSANFGATDAAWADGDLDLDGKVDFTDFLLLSANFGSTK